jgi:hypothetical protein
MKIGYALIAFLFVGCGPKEDPIQRERETVKGLLHMDVSSFLGSSIDGGLNHEVLYHHGTEGQFGVDYTLCGAVSVWERPGGGVPDHTSDNLFIVTMRMGNKGRILGESDIQLSDTSPTSMTHSDALNNMFCSNSDSPLPARFEPPSVR